MCCCNWIISVELEKQIKEFQEKREALNKANVNESSDKVCFLVLTESIKLRWALNKVTEKDLIGKRISNVQLDLVL